MPESQLPAAITVTKMAEMISLSRSRLYSLIDRGILPGPAQVESSKRPVYVRELIAQVLEIRRTGVGANGELVTFNAKRKQRRSKQPTRRKDTATPTISSDHSEIVTGLQSLGLEVTDSQVAALLAEHFPSGIEDAGEAIRQLFLLLKQQD